jgi:hypothetical protein
MATESIGALVPTAIPGYEDAADIQSALRAYHYGSYSYNPANTSTASLVNPSIAYTITNLQSQITAIGSGGINPSILTAKGGLITATAASTPVQLTVGGSNGMVLTVNNATATGLEWAAPVVTPTNSVTLTNKTLTSPVISTIVNTGTLTLPTSTDTLVGRATTDTLTNKTLTSPILTTPSIGVATGTSFNSITGLSSTTPSANGAAAVGTATTTARADHVHPTTGLGLTASGLNQFAATTSAQLAGVISDETGSGALVFATSPTLTTPSIGVATGTSFNSITGLSATTPSANGSAAVGTATTTARADHVHPTTGLGLTASGLNQFAATTSAQLAGVISDETGSGALVFATSPTLSAAILAGGSTVSYTTTSGGAIRNTWMSTADPTTEGADGDVWVKYTA